jgi:hypothetical protein
MATIRNLSPSITDLNQEEALALIRKLRVSRRTSKKKPLPLKLDADGKVKLKRVAKPKVAKLTKNPAELMAMLSPEEQIKLFQEMGIEL